MTIIRRDYRLDVSKLHISLGDTSTDESNPLVLAMKERYKDAYSIQLTEGAIIVEFPATVLTFLMSDDMLDYYHAMLAGNELKPRSLHIWRAVLGRDEERNAENTETIAAN